MPKSYNVALKYVQKMQQFDRKFKKNSMNDQGR